LPWLNYAYNNSLRTTMTSLLAKIVSKGLHFLDRVTFLQIKYILLFVAITAATQAATVTNLAVRYSKGQVFVTFQEVAGNDVRYQVYRSKSPIVSKVTGLTPIATLPQNSGTNLYTNTRFVVTDTGAPLPPKLGLLVYTCHTNDSFYYAVTNSLDSAIVTGVNSLSLPVQETRLDVPGAVQIAKDSLSAEGATVIKYFAWEDYASWDTLWGYYGHRFNVVYEPRAINVTKQNPLTLRLHSAGTNGYAEPGILGVSTGVSIIPRDLGFYWDQKDPFTKTQRYYSGWFGYSTKGFAIPCTERRCIRYINLVKTDPKFRIDSTRIYVTGGSLGGGGAMHMAYHHPEIFAAAAATVGWVSYNKFVSGIWTSEYGSAGDSMRVNDATGPAVWNWQNSIWIVNSKPKSLPPLIHTFRKDDNVVNPAEYPELLQQTEAHKYFQISGWKNGGHDGFGYSTSPANYFRFRKNEAYPVFTKATNSDSFLAVEGQRNLYLDWSSSLSDLVTESSEDDIFDTANTFAITFKSLSGSDAKADFTLRNAQQFKVEANTRVHWKNIKQQGAMMIDSGSVQADAQGLITIPQLLITTGMNRLRLFSDQTVGTQKYIPHNNEKPPMSVAIGSKNFASTITITLNALPT